MKKFFTVVPLQKNPKDLGLVTYQAVGNSRLQMERQTSFPILTAVNGYVQPGESFRLIGVMTKNEATHRNREELYRQLKELCGQNGLKCPNKVEEVFIDDSQEVSAHVDTFQKLLDYVDDDDELFTCMTFGTKPLSHAMLLAMQYAYRVKKNASISCIVYGTGPWDGSKVYDMTALIQLDEIVHILAERGVADPKGTLERILSL